jgi:hypothetical protein
MKEAAREAAFFIPALRRGSESSSPASPDRDPGHGSLRSGQDGNPRDVSN